MSNIGEVYDRWYGGECDEYPASPQSCKRKKHCSRCTLDGLEWQHTPRGYRLFENGKEHVCDPEMVRKRRVWLRDSFFLEALKATKQGGNELPRTNNS